MDYLITSHGSLEKVKYFSVGEFHPSLSDHCPISTSISLYTPLQEQPLAEPILLDLPKRYIWNPDGRDSFSKQINSESFKSRVDEILVMPDHPGLIDRIETLVTDAADASDVKKSSTKPPKTDPQWFDDTCKDLKRQILLRGKDLRKNPNNPTTREKIYILKRKLRTLVKKNKYLFKKSIVDKMCSDLSKGQQKTYWKLLKKT